jgi:hypothetical protein
LRFSAALAQNYIDTAAYDTELDKFIEAGVASGGASDPLWRVMSTADGIFSAEQLLDIGILAEVRQTDRNEAVSFRRDQLRNMLAAYVRDVQTSNQRAKDARDCKVDELLVIAGQRVPMIVERILPRLVLRREQEGRTFFEPDVVARAYVRSLYVKGEEVRALSEYAAIDDTYKALALAAVGGGVAMLASKLGYLGAAAYAMVTADAIDVVYFGTKGVLDYQKGEDFYEFAKGASAAYGSAFLEDAAAQRQSALGAAAGVLLPGAGVAWGTLGDLRHLAKTGRGAEIARRLGSIDAAGLARLSDAERLDLLAYVDDVRRTGQLAEAKGVWDNTKALFTSTGRKLDSGDTDFLQSFDTFAADAKARIERGRDVASRLDTFDGDALKPLTAAERADLSAYAENVKFRENALASGEFGSRIAVPSAREVEFAGKYDEMARAADGVDLPAAGGAAATRLPLPSVTVPNPDIASAVDVVPAVQPQPTTPRNRSPRFDYLDTPAGLERAASADGLLPAERARLKQLERQIDEKRNEFVLGEAAEDRQLAELTQLRLQRRSLVDEGMEHLGRFELRARQDAAPDYRIPNGSGARLQTHAEHGSVPLRQLVPGDQNYVANIMGLSIRPTQKDIYASTVNKNVQQILDGGPFPTSRDGGKIKLLKVGDNEYVILQGHHRVVAAQIASRLTGRPLLPDQATGGVRSIIPKEHLDDSAKITDRVEANWRTIGVRADDP